MVCRCAGAEHTSILSAWMVLRWQSTVCALFARVQLVGAQTVSWQMHSVQLADALCSTLYKLPHVADPSDEIVEVLIQCMEWNIVSRQSGIPESELPELQQKAVDLLDLLTKNLPDKTGEKAKWNFEKAHSILHKVREIVLWGNSDNTSCQAPEVNTNVYVHVCTYYVH